MADVQQEERKEISFASELVRKGTHMGALIIPGGYYYLRLERGEMLSIMIPITLLMIGIDIARLRQWKIWTGFLKKIISPLIRSHEIAGDFTGATYILLSVCFTVALFDKMVAIAALAFIIVGDTFAALVGRRFGRHKFGRKSVEGSAACLVGTLLVAWIVPGIPWEVKLFGAVVAAVVEALPLGIDDNTTVPILSGLFMTLFDKFLINL